VIDQGRIAWDGPLQELVHKVHPEKRVSLKLSADVASADLEGFGARVVNVSGREVRLSVAQSGLAACITHLLSKLPVLDLTVEDPPLEEVLSDLFERKTS